MVVVSHKLAHIEIFLSLIKQHGLTFDKVKDKYFIEILETFKKGLEDQSSEKVSKPLLKEINEILDDKRYK